MRKRKSWREKLAANKGLPQVKKITPEMSNRWGTGTVVIPAPMEVNDLMKLVPKGKVTTLSELRSVLAAKHGATIGCPITTGIFAWIAAHAAEEAAAAGNKSITPYWRTLKTGGQVNEKYPGGIAQARRLLRAEGHTIVKKRQHYFVADYQKFLFTPSVSS
jgi:alkylated DNA nucleotide flippase Atl1